MVTIYQVLVAHQTIHYRYGSVFLTEEHITQHPNGIIRANLIIPLLYHPLVHDCCVRVRPSCRAELGYIFMRKMIVRGEE
jgi:hypothetical protein